MRLLIFLITFILDVFVSTRRKIINKRSWQLFCLHVDKGKCKEARNVVQKLICSKKTNYIESKMTENIGKPKEL